jgi:hypothetical protein
MIIANFNDAASLDAALQQAFRLWPDPWEAPEVSPRDILQLYQQGVQNLPSEFRSWLPGQIQASVNCQRALEELRAETNPEHLLHPVLTAFRPGIPPSVSGYIGQTSSSGEEKSPATGARAHPKPVGAVDPAPDQLWTTRPRVAHFNGRGMESRYTWRPLNVLLVEPQPAGRGEVLWRAIPCTPLWVWGEENVGSDEAVIALEDEEEYVAHFTLEYPVHARQLYACIGVAKEVELEPGRAQTTPELVLERERLLDCASWLSATADARLRWYESLAQPPGAAELDLEKATTWRDRQERKIGTANLASLEPVTLCILWREDLSTLYQSITGGDLPGLFQFAARVQDEPQEDAERPGNCLARWEVDDPEACERLQAGNTFHVVKGKNFAKIVGHGLIQQIAGKILARLEIGRWPDFRETGELTLLFPNSL